MVIRVIWVILLVLIVVPMTLAETPRDLVFQNTLYNNGGDVTGGVTKTYEARLYNSLTGGTLLFSQVGSFTTESSGDTAGQYTLTLEDVDINYNQNIFLELKIGSETLTPRVAINQVPFSFLSNETLSIGNFTYSNNSRPEYYPNLFTQTNTWEGAQIVDNDFKMRDDQNILLGDDGDIALWFDSTDNLFNIASDGNIIFDQTQNGMIEFRDTTNFTDNVYMVWANATQNFTSNNFLYANGSRPEYTNVSRESLYDRPWQCSNPNDFCEMNDDFKITKATGNITFADGSAIAPYPGGGWIALTGTGNLDSIRDDQSILIPTVPGNDFWYGGYYGEDNHRFTGAISNAGYNIITSNMSFNYFGKFGTRLVWGVTTYNLFPEIVPMDGAGVGVGIIRNGLYLRGVDRNASISLYNEDLSKYTQIQYDDQQDSLNFTSASGGYIFDDDIEQTAGNATLSLIYAELYGHGYWTQTIGDANTYYNITNTTLGEVNGFSHNVYSGGELLVEVAGTYNINGQLSFSGQTGSEVHMVMAVNNFTTPTGETIKKCHLQRKLGGTDVGSAGFTCMRSLSIGDTLNLMTETSDGNDIEIHDLGFTIMRVGI